MYPAEALFLMILAVPAVLTLEALRA
jgi:hypothetical protein